MRCEMSFHKKEVEVEERKRKGGKTQEKQGKRDTI